MIISKSKYLRYCQCPKILWIEKYKNELVEKKLENAPLYNPTKIVDEFSKSLFNSEDGTVYLDTKKEKYNFEEMSKKTNSYLENPSTSLHKAVFEFSKLYFVVDILKKVKNGYNVYLVKPSKNLRQAFLKEMAYIAYILQKKNIQVYRYCIITIDSQFKNEGKIDPKKYFKINYVGNKIKTMLGKVENHLSDYENMINSNIEPNISYGPQCQTFYQCPYAKYCQKPLPNPSVFDLYAFGKKMELYSKDILSFQDILNNNIPLTEFQKRQINHNLLSLPTYIDKQNLKEYLQNFKYPLYFLDFETTQEIIPIHKGVGPFDLIPFQYSLHYILEKDGTLYHTDFLAKEDQDPREELVKQLVNDIPINSCIIAYNISFERKVIQDLANQFPQYKEHLLALTKNFIDLIVPFEKGYVYDKLMNGSISLKSVLPALYPNNIELSYANLEDVHNGRDARLAFPTLSYLNNEDRKLERENLLKYCYLDTFAMVKILEKLVELSK